MIKSTKQKKLNITQFHFQLAGLFIISLAIRIVYLMAKDFDYWGDSYHHLYTSWSSFESLTYTDIKSNHLFWLPGYHLFGIILVPLTHQPNLLYFQIMNIVLGSLSTVLVADIIQKLYNSNLKGITTGFLLAISSLHVVYSTMNMAEIFAGFFFLLMIRSFHLNHQVRFLLSYVVCIMTRYELWILIHVYLGLSILLTNPQFPRKMVLVTIPVVFTSWLVIWSFWSYIHTSNAFYWIITQSDTLRWDMLFHGKLSALEIISLYNQPVILLAVVFTVIHILIVGIRNYISDQPFFLILIVVLFVKFCLNLFFNFIPLNDARYLLLDLHLFVLLLPNIHQVFLLVISRFMGEKQFTAVGIEKIGLSISKEQIQQFWISVLVLLFAVIIINAQLTQIEIYRAKEYVITPQESAGAFMHDWMAQNLEDDRSKVLIDNPVVAYYAKLHPDQIVTSENIAGRDVIQYIKRLDVKLLVLQDVSYSNFTRQYPYLNQFPDNITTEDIEFELIYSYGGWELEFGADNVWIYSLAYL